MITLGAHDENSKYPARFLTFSFSSSSLPLSFSSLPPLFSFLLSFSSLRGRNGVAAQNL